MHHVHTFAMGCTRWYYLTWWNAFTRGMAHAAALWHDATEGRDWFDGAGSGRPLPLWHGPSVPLYNTTHDAWVHAQRLASSV